MIVLQILTNLNTVIFIVLLIWQGVDAYRSESATQDFISRYDHEKIFIKKINVNLYRLRDGQQMPTELLDKWKTLSRGYYYRTFYRFCILLFSVFYTAVIRHYLRPF